jgi:uncharacterized repeat protein (TIGR01451 family)
MAAFTYEGDAIYNGDHFTMNGAQVTNAMNPADNFFNSSRTFLGAGVSGASDVPKFTGAPGEMAGYDLDTIDVTAQLAAGDTTCDVGADSSYDIFLLGGFVTSVTNLAPYFQPTKVVEDLNGLPTVEGDVLEYTIAATNTGNDDAIDVVLTDVIESGLKFVPGSISIEKGGALGSKTDASGDDQGEYSSGSKTVTVRVGAGADKQDGGTIGVGEEFEVRFRVTVAAIDGQVSNQGSLSASGASGAGEKTYLTDGDPSTVVADPTTIDVGQCASDADCPLEKPHCDVNLGICQPCATDADCSDPAKPACQPDGTCGECSATNASLCVDQKPVCDANQGNCVFCIPGADGDASICVDSSDGPECVPGPNDTTHCGCFEDSNCGDLKSGRVCEGVNELCINGCRGIGGNGCPDGFVCTSEDTSIGECVPFEPGDSGGAAEEDGGCACRAAGHEGSERDRRSRRHRPPRSRRGPAPRASPRSLKTPRIRLDPRVDRAGSTLPSESDHVPPRDRLSGLHHRRGEGRHRGRDPGRRRRGDGRWWALPDRRHRERVRGQRHGRLSPHGAVRHRAHDEGATWRPSTRWTACARRRGSCRHVATGPTGVSERPGGCDCAPG